VTRALCRQAGVVVADTLEEFDDLVTTFALLRGREPGGRRLGAVSNAGFEAVAIADAVEGFTLATFGGATRRRLQEVFARARIDALVDVHNPLDVTPMAADAAYEEVVRAILADDEVDVAIVGCVPMTAALQTLPASARHDEDLSRDDAVVSRLARVWREGAKPWVAVVDAGPLYDPMAAALEAAGVPTFRTADRAMRLLRLYCDARARALHPLIRDAAQPAPAL
jgi:acyl-CoA synthetase (NDP forming)